jgi:hypothetical protein
MVGVVLNAKLPPDQLSDPFQGPQVGPMAGGQGAGQKKLRQPSFLMLG